MMKAQSVAEAALFFTIGFCVAMYVGDTLEWGAIDVSWETLAAGGMAIVAAYLTIIQMRRSDAAADARRRDAAIMEIKKGREIASRTATLCFPRLLTCQEVLKTIMDEGEAVDWPSLKKHWGHFTLMGRHITRIGTELQRARSILEPRGERAMLDLLEAAEGLSDIGAKMENFIRQQSDFDLAREWDILGIDSAQTAVSHIDDTLRAIATVSRESEALNMYLDLQLSPDRS